MSTTADTFSGLQSDVKWRQFLLGTVRSRVEQVYYNVVNCGSAQSNLSNKGAGKILSRKCGANIEFALIVSLRKLTFCILQNIESAMRFEGMSNVSGDYSFGRYYEFISFV